MILLINALIPLIGMGVGVYLLGGIVALGWFLVIVGGLRIILTLLENLREYGQ